MKKFKDIIFEKNVVVHCPERWMANKLQEYADSKGVRWVTGRYRLDEDPHYKLYGGIYSNFSSMEQLNYKILHYNDVVLIKEEGETMIDHHIKLLMKNAKEAEFLFYAIKNIRHILDDDILLETINKIDGMFQNPLFDVNHFSSDDLDNFDKILETEYFNVRGAYAVNDNATRRDLLLYLIKLGRVNIEMAKYLVYHNGINAINYYRDVMIFPQTNK